MPSTSTEIRVRYAETDQMGVAYHAHYLVWCEVGRTDFIRSLGTTYRDLEATGITLAVSDAHVRYHAPARYDDVIQVLTTLSDVASRALIFEYVLANAASGARLATASTTLVPLDSQGRVRAMTVGLRRALSERGGDGATRAT